MVRFTGIATLLFLILAGVPWYWQYLPWTGNQLWLGVPAWFAVSVAVSILVSIATALQFLRPWPGEVTESRFTRLPTDERTDGDAFDAGEGL